MQLAGEPRRLRLVDDEGEVEVGGGLGDEVDGPLLEDLQQRPEAMEDRADLPPDEGDRRARPEHRRAADGGEVGGERREPLG